MFKRFLMSLLVGVVVSLIVVGWMLPGVTVPSLMVTSEAVVNSDSATEVTLPRNAIGPAIPNKKGYLVEEIRDGLYWVTDGLYNTMFLVYDAGAVAIDAPPTIGANYLHAIRDITDKPITHVIYSHSHADHIGAASVFPPTADYIAQEETAEILTRRHDVRRPLPTTTFQDQYTLTVSDQTLELAYHGNVHQAGNIFIYAPKQKVLMLVDIIYPGWVPYKNLGIAEDVQSYIAGHDIALTYDFDWFLGGHVTRLGTRQDVLESQTYVNDLKQAASQAYQAIAIADIAQQTPNPNPFKIYDAYQDALSQFCTERMLQTWQSRLGAAETYTPDNCWIMVEALGVDLAPDADGL